MWTAKNRGRYDRANCDIHTEQYEAEGFERISRERALAELSSWPPSHQQVLHRDHQRSCANNRPIGRG